MDLREWMGRDQMPKRTGRKEMKKREQTARRGMSTRVGGKREVLDGMCRCRCGKDDKEADRGEEETGGGRGEGGETNKEAKGEMDRRWLFLDVVGLAGFCGWDCSKTAGGGP